MAVVKPKDRKMISNRCSLSHLCELLLSHLCAIAWWVCVTNRESHSLFILVFDLTITYQGRLHYEILITLVPLNCGDYFPDLQWRVNLYDFTWLDYINDSPNRNIRDQWNTIYKIYKWIHSEVTNTSTNSTNHIIKFCFRTFLI